MRPRRLVAGLLAATLALSPWTPRPAAGAETGDALVPAGTAFSPPPDVHIDFGGDPPAPRQPVDKDTRIVAVVFSVNEMESIREEFPDVPNVDLMPIAGTPMIRRVIDGLRSSRYVDKVIVVGAPELPQALGLTDDPNVTFIEDRGDAAENVRYGIHTISRGDLVLLAPSDLPMLSGKTLDQLIEHARQYNEIDVFFPLIQRERCADTVAEEQRFIHFKEGEFTGAHVEIVRPALFVDNPDDVANEKGTMYDVYHMRRDALGVARFLGLRLVVKFILRDLSPTDVVTRVYAKYHVRAQAFVATDPRLAADVHSPEVITRIEARLRETARPPAPLAGAAAAAPGQT